MKMIDEIRRENLAAIRDECGSVVALANKLNRQESQISQWLNGSANSATGKPRGMRASTARWIESECNKVKGWLDIDHSEKEKASQMQLRITPLEQELLRDFDLILEDDKKLLIIEIKRLANIARAYRDKFENELLPKATGDPPPKKRPRGQPGLRQDAKKLIRA